MWTATIDFMKAFDFINHNSIWDALKNCVIEHEYISLLKGCTKKKKTTVMTDKEIKKGTKQGDPLSSLLLNTVPQVALKDDFPRWQKQKEWANA